MIEYDKKIEEVRELCEWFHEHEQEVISRGDGIVLAAVYGDPQHITNQVIGKGFLIQNILVHLAIGAMGGEGEGFKEHGELQ